MSTLTSNIGATAGPLYIAYLLQWGLFGALSVQVYHYHLVLSTDPPYKKALVYGVYVAEFMQTILATKMGFKQYAAGFGDLEALETIGLLWFVAPVMTAMVSFVVQVFYAYRIKMFTQSYIITIVVVVLALAQLAGGIAEGILASGIAFFSSDSSMQKLNVASSVWNGCSAACDVLIAVAMTYSLSRRKTTWQPTQRTIQRLTRLIIATGALTATVAIVNLVLFVLPGDHPTYYQTSTAILGKLYSNTMMVVFNSRIVFSRNEKSSNYSSMDIDFPRRPQDNKPTDSSGERPQNEE